MFTIGEFSRIARVTARQLRHYEALGLFKPEYIDPETGYRSYSALQLPRLNRILTLKDLGFSLAQILRLLDEDISAGEIRGMLTMRKAQIEQTVHDELERVQTIEARLGQIEEKGLLADDVILKAMPARNFLSLRQVVPSREEGFALITELHRFLALRSEKHVVGNFAVIFHSEGFETENVDVEMGFLLEQERFTPFPLSEGRAMTVRSVPAIETMATMVYVGIAHHIRCYGQLGTWIERNHFQLAGPGWEVFIEPFQAAKLDEAVIEIQLPVTRRGNDRDFDHALITQ